MASIHQDIAIDVPPARVWEAVRDVGSIHEKLASGFVVDTVLEDAGVTRVVTFGNGMVVREVIVDVDDERRRLAWSIVGSAMTHHNASLQIYALGHGRSRAVWIADLLPDALASVVDGMIAQGLEAMKKTLER